MSVYVKCNEMTEKKLFRVDGELVEKYNRALDKLIGRKTELKCFHIGKRGESPEIEAELGENYLQNSPSHRYIITVSPNQKEADLLHQEFSFDHELIDFLYENHMPGISVATRVDGLYGELDDKVRAFHTLEDLLLLRKVEVELHTPSDFLDKSRTLQNYVAQLKENPQLLITDNSGHLYKILDLVKQVGDIRDYNLSEIKMSLEIGSFSTRLFGGVYVFREGDTIETIPIKRPDRKYTSDRAGTHHPTVVIHNVQDYDPPQESKVKFIRFEDTQKIVEFLIDQGYARYSEDLIEERLARIEDIILLDLGFDVAEMGQIEKEQVLHRNIDSMPEIWKGLRNMERQAALGEEFDDIFRKADPSISKSLLMPLHPHGTALHDMEESIISKLFAHDFERMYAHNYRDLEHIYSDCETNKRKYIISVVKYYQIKRKELGYE